MRNIIVISDTHCGCQFGLCPPVVQLDSGGEYRANKFQNDVYKKWLLFWNEWVPRVTEKEQYIIVHNGDVIDGVHHGTVTQISQNINDQLIVAQKCLEPIITNKNCVGYYHIRGTEAHVGKSGQYEEMLARSLGAVKDEFGNYARFEMWMQLQSSLIHFSHHIGTTGSVSYESTAPHKELVEAYLESGRWGDHPPDLVVRSHRHRQYEERIASKNGYTMSITTPGWQLKTPIVHRSASGRSSSPQIGGYLIRYGKDDGLFTRFKVWRIPRAKTVKI